MTKEIKTFKLAKILAKFIQDEASDDEKEVVSNWLESSPSNKALFEKCKNEQNQRRRFSSYEKIDWQKDFYAFLNKKKRLEFKLKLYTTLKYAAALFIPIAFTAYFFFLSDNPFSFNKITVLTAGGNKATLTMADGRLIDLVSDTNKLYRERDGSRLVKGDGSLSYNTINMISQEKIADRTLKSIYNKLNVPRGGEWKLTLCDGTKVWVNAESSLSYPVSFVGNKRIVYLSGEAYFEVAENKEIPFIVVANKSEIEVLGTSFNVKAYKEDVNIATTLVEGSVKYKSKITNEEVILEPGEQGVMHAIQGYILKQKVDVSYYTVWKDGRFAFRKERLEDIMARLSKWYDIEVEFRGKGLKNKTFTGNLKRYDNLNQILEIMEENKLISFKVRKNRLILENYD